MKVTYHNVRPATLKLADDFLKNHNMSPRQGNNGTITGADLKFEFEYNPDKKSLSLEVIDHPAGTTPGIILGRIKDLLSSVQESGLGDCDVKHEDGDPDVPSLIKVYFINQTQHPLFYSSSDLSAGYVYWSNKKSIPVGPDEVHAANIQMGTSWTAAYPSGTILFNIGNGAVVIKLKVYGPIDKEGAFSVEFYPDDNQYTYELKHCQKNDHCQTIHRVVVTPKLR